VIDWFKARWALSGTKILGIVASAWATLTALLAYLSADPQVQFLLPHKWFVVLSMVNIALGFFTIRRGFVNTANINASNT
jgi:hypothetical protein